MLICAVNNRIYYIFAAGVYGVMFTVLVLAIVFGLRARMKSKDGVATRLPHGFSPLDIQRVLGGRTYPRRVTKALLYHWANMGYIQIEAQEDGKFAVKVLKKMPPHDDKSAEFFDRGTYVRERTIFHRAFPMKKNTVSPRAPLLSKEMQSGLRTEYAVREDEGVYGQAHYVLKMITQVLALLPILLSATWAVLYNKSNLGLAFMLIFVIIGVLAMRHLTVVPAGFRIPFFSIWGGAPTVAFAVSYGGMTYDPLCIGIASAVFTVLCTYVLIQFIDVREKNNLEEYGEIARVKRFLRSAKREKLTGEDFAALLPLIYTLPSMRLYKWKFRDCPLPAWFTGKRRAL